MNNYLLLSGSLLTILLFSCTSLKNKSSDSTLTNTKWELEYIQSNTSFKNLYPDQLPQITLHEATNEISGNSGCNGYSAIYTLKNSIITISNPVTSTLMYCPGDGEPAFREIMPKINNYKIDKENKLHLNIDKTSAMIFKKVK